MNYCILYLKSKLYTYLNVLIFSCSLFLLTACEKDDDFTWVDPDISYLECIWDAAPNSVFTDLVEYNNRYYCVFREGYGHIPHNKKEYGRIRILESIDGLNWYSIGYLQDGNYDLRDPKISITPGNQLLIMYGCSALTDKNDLYFVKTMVSIIESLQADNQTFEKITDYDVILSNDNYRGYWLWRIKWHKGIAYGVAYSAGRTPILVSSEDGINYNIIAELNNLDNANEADISFSSDGTMIIIIRSNSGNGYLGEALAPYTEWNWVTLNHPVHCPKIVSLDDETLIIGRGENGINTLYCINKNKTISPLYKFPSKGDSGYSGAIITNKELWVSYYTSFGKSSIYLTKIPIVNVLNKIRMLKN